MDKKLFIFPALVLLTAFSMIGLFVCYVWEVGGMPYEKIIHTQTAIVMFFGLCQILAIVVTEIENDGKDMG